MVAFGSVVVHTSGRWITATVLPEATASCCVAAAHASAHTSPVAASCCTVDVRFCHHRFAATGFNSKATWFGINKTVSNFAFTPLMTDGPEVEHGAHFLILYYPFKDNKILELLTRVC